MGELLQEQAEAFEVERRALREQAAQQAEQMHAQLAAAQQALLQAQEEARQRQAAPGEGDWAQLQGQLAAAREEREAAREQLGTLSNQLMEVQTREAMLKAELMQVQDDMQTAIKHDDAAAPAPSDKGDALERAASKFKGFGGKVGGAFKKKTAERDNPF